MEDKAGRKDTVETIPAPDGGWGWVILVAAFVVYFITDGWLFTFGLFYPEFLYHFQEGHGHTATIGAMLHGVPRMLSPVLCALVNVFGCRSVAIAGGMIMAISLILSTFATSVNYLCVTLGFFWSIGFCAIQITTIFMLTFYFDKRRGLATGLAYIGSSLGSFVFPPLMELCMEYYSWRGTILLLGGITFHVVASGGLYRPLRSQTVHSSKTESMLDDNIHEGENAKSLLYAKQEHRPSTCDRKSSVSISHPDQDILPSSYTKALSAPRINMGSMTLNGHLTETQTHQYDSAQNQKTALMSSSCPDLNQERASKSEHVKLQDASSTKIHSGKCQPSLQKGLQHLQTFVHKSFDISVFKDIPFTVFCVSAFILFLFVIVPYVYLVDRSVHNGYSDNQSAMLLSVIGLGKAAGMVVLGRLGDVRRLHPVTVYSIAIITTGAMTCLIPQCHNYVSLCIVCAIFGFGLSVNNTLLMICVVRIIGFIKSTGAYGLLQLGIGLGALIGTPVAGILYESQGDYDMAFYVAGAMICVSGCLILPLPFITKRGRDKSLDITIEE